MRKTNLSTYAIGLALVLTLSGCKLSDLAKADLDPALPVVTNPVVTNAVRVSNVRDLVNQMNAGQTDAQIIAGLGSDWSQAERAIIARGLANNEGIVWQDASGNVVGNVYFDPRTNSLIRPSLDGDVANDAGINIGFADLSFCGALDCADNDPNGPAVAPSLVAKHTADYAGTGTITVDAVGSVTRDYTAATTNSLSANFDNGTIGGTSTHHDGGTATGEVSTLLLYNGAIHGSNFEGDMAFVDNPGNSVLDENNGSYRGSFGPDGTAATASGSGIVTGTSATGFNWQENYTLNFRVAEQ